MSNSKPIKDLEEKIVLILRYVVAADKADANVSETIINEFKDSITKAFDKFESEFVDEQYKDHETLIASLGN
jgi:hypothetical protein